MSGIPNGSAAREYNAKAPLPILFTIPNFITAGSGRVMLNIVERLDRQRFAPTVCVLKRGGRLDADVEEMGIPLIEAAFTVPARPYHSLPARLRRAAGAFRERGFALWHSFHYMDDYTEPLIARLAAARVWVYTKKAMGWGSRAWLLRSYLANRIVADNSDMPRTMFDRVGLRSKVRLIHHGIPTEVYAKGITQPLGVRGRLRIGAEEVVVGCVAHLVPVKGHPTLIEAVARVPSVRLLIAGDSLDAEYHASLVARCSALGMSDRVHFLGGVREVPALLAELDVFVLPTWAKWRMEGCPVALLEAMACGLPCVATDIPGSRDLVEHGQSGWIVPPEDPDAMADALRTLAGSPERRESLGAAARERVVRHFSIEKEVAAHEALYAELLGLD
jgi:glycosyltransferase involved in cell wall biosynthesis